MRCLGARRLVRQAVLRYPAAKPLPRRRARAALPSRTRSKAGVCLIFASATTSVSLLLVPSSPSPRALPIFSGNTTFPPSPPGAKASRIETSKAWAKDLFAQANISTPKAQITDSHKEAQIILARWTQFPVVVKADGLAQGKGVVVATTRRQAEEAVEHAMVEKRFGKAGTTLLFEEHLEGQELSYFSLCDGCEDNVRFFGAARDYKRAQDDDKGKNTGGMGAFALAPPMGEQGSLEERAVRDSIVLPLLRRLAKSAEPYRGILFLGLMATRSGVHVLEANARLGDPEAQTLLPLLEGDLVETFLAAAKGQRLRQDAQHRGSRRTFDFTESVHSVTVVAAAKGYPAKPQTGSAIKKLDAIEASPDLSLFHAGTVLQGAEEQNKGEKGRSFERAADVFFRSTQEAARFQRRAASPTRRCKRSTGQRASTERTSPATRILPPS